MNTNPPLTFHIIFHGPFRVGTGRATGRGADSGIDHAQPLPAESLKGLMRASARTLLSCTLNTEHDLISEVFGAASQPSPWAWTPAFPRTGRWPHPTLSARVRIDPDTHSAVEDYLATVEQIWPDEPAIFDVEPIGIVPPDRLTDQRLLLRAAACGIHALGADRRRGLGWVTVSCPADPLTDTDIIRLQHLRRSHA
jgi:hypothetical protein